MDKWEKRGNIIGASIFGALGLVALGGVIFAGAVHQLVVVAICGAMSAASIAEIKCDRRRAKSEESKTVNR